MIVHAYYVICIPMSKVFHIIQFIHFFCNLRILSIVYEHYNSMCVTKVLQISRNLITHKYFFCLFHSTSTLFIRFQIRNPLEASAILKRTVLFVNWCILLHHVTQWCIMIQPYYTSRIPRGRGWRIYCF